MKLDTNTHSVFLMQYYLALSTKNGLPVINDAIDCRLKDIFESIAGNYNISVEKWICRKKEVHILFKAHPNSELSKFINAYKSASSRLIKKEFPSAKEILSENQFWAKGFCLLTVGLLGLDTIEAYMTLKKLDCSL